MNKNLWITMLRGVQEEISGMKWVNPLMTNFLHHRETSQFICSANQLTDVYMMRNIFH